MRHTLCVILFTLSILFMPTLHGQTKVNVSGYLFDIETLDPISYGAVRILNVSDSSFIHGAASDTTGFFKIPLAPDKYVMQITSIGYKSYFKGIVVKTDKMSIDSIFMQPDVLSLDETVIEAKMPDISVNGDTVVYNAKAFTVEESERLQDVIKRIPGAEIGDNGSIKINGKPVTKILVNKKEFFGNDIQKALTSLPANVIKNLQLYNEESDQAKATGMKDADPPQVLNLNVKKEFMKSMFGDAAAGYGGDNRYKGSMNVNKLHEDNNFSLVGDMGSNNQSGGSGDSRSRDVGFSMNLNPSKKAEVNGNSSYADGRMEDNSYSQSYQNLLDRYSSNTHSHKNSNNGVNIGAYIQWRPDSLTSISFRTDGRASHNESLSYSTDTSYVSNENSTIGYSISNNNYDNKNINSSVMISRRLNEKGRNIGVNVIGSLSNQDGRGSNFSHTEYPDGTAPLIIDQQSATNSDSHSYGISLFFVEPLTKEQRIQIGYSINSSQADRDNDVRKKDLLTGEYSVVDSAYSRLTKSSYLSNNVNVNYQLSKEKYNFNIGFRVESSNSNNKVLLGDSTIEVLKQKVINYSPNLHFNYRPAKNANINANYSGYSRQPDSRQLSADTVINSALSKSVGNPDLKPELSNNFNIYFSKSNPETGRYFNLSSSYSFTVNRIANYTVTDKKGNTFNTYRNVNGNMNANLYGSYNTPLRNKKLSLSMGTSLGYSRGVDYRNEQKSLRDNLYLSPNASIRFNSEKFETRAYLSYNINYSWNNLSDPRKSETSSIYVGNESSLRLPYDIKVGNFFAVSYRSGMTGNYRKTEFLWRASVSKSVLKGKKGMISLECADILNNRNPESYFQSGQDWNYSRRNITGRFVMFSFRYQFNFMSKEKDGNPPASYRQISPRGFSSSRF